MDLMSESVIGAAVYLLLTLLFTSKFIEGKFDKINKKIEEAQTRADSRDDENEAYIRRLEVILQVYLQKVGLPPPYGTTTTVQTEVKKNIKPD